MKWACTHSLLCAPDYGYDVNNCLKFLPWLTEINSPFSLSCLLVRMFFFFFITESRTITSKVISMKLLESHWHRRNPRWSTWLPRLLLIVVTVNVSSFRVTGKNSPMALCLATIPKARSEWQNFRTIILLEVANLYHPFHFINIKWNS